MRTRLPRLDVRMCACMCVFMCTKARREPQGWVLIYLFAVYSYLIFGLEVIKISNNKTNKQMKTNLGCPESTASSSPGLTVMDNFICGF